MPGAYESGPTALGPVDEPRDRRQPLEVRSDVRRDPGEDLALGPEERVPDERRERARRDGEADVELRHPLRRDLDEELAPPGDRISPLFAQPFVCEAHGPELP